MNDYAKRLMKGDISEEHLLEYLNLLVILNKKHGSLKVLPNGICETYRNYLVDQEREKNDSASNLANLIGFGHHNRVLNIDKELFQL
jgi:hypothetical protein